MKDFKDLLIWNRSHSFTLKIYCLTKSFPQSEMYGLVSQLRKSSSSIPTNIAEGCGRDSDADFKRFLTITMGSASELEYQLILAKDLEFISFDIFMELNLELIEIRKMLNSFIQKVKSRIKKAAPNS